MRIWFTALLMPVVVLGCGIADDGSKGGPSAFVALDDRNTQLREDFNRAKGSVRLLFVVDPTCGGCLLGMANLNDDLLAKTSDPRLRTFVVHVPVIGAASEDVAPSQKLLPRANVTHYWNGSGAFGRELAEAVGLRRGRDLVYAFDVWLIYGPEATWEGVSPPRPRLLMQQLSELEGTEFPALDSAEFARVVRKLLAGLDEKDASQ